MTIDRNHIDKVFSQKFSFLDQKNLVKYFEDSSLNEETKLLVKKQWEEFVPETDSNLNLDHVFHKLYYNINTQNDSSNNSRRYLFLKYSQIAAVLIVGLLIAASIYFSNSPAKYNSTQEVEFVSHSGFRNQFKLPDGSTGWLGYNSKLTYHLDDKNRRIVDLDGLAFFNVTHQKNQSFIVKTPAKLNIEVLGTRFNVSAYSEDKTSEIILEQGSVTLNLPERKVGVMVPNDRVIYHLENNSIEKSSVNVSDYVAWKDGKLILDDVSLKETCLKLGRFYNVDFELQSNEFDNQKVRLVLEDETLDEALKLLAMIVPVKCEVEKRTIRDDNSYSKKRILITKK